MRIDAGGVQVGYLRLLLIDVCITGVSRPIRPMPTGKICTLPSLGRK
ncbi:Uncharacterised protein [Vibrio cholerae]|nr:Uncharacterised protein [Vibrio cholerae]